MKSRGSASNSGYKKKSRYSGSHFSWNQTRTQNERKKQASTLVSEKMAHSGTQIFWGSEARPDGSSPSKLVKDKTWGLSFQHFSEVNTDFVIKAGSKKMILNSTPTTSVNDSSRVIRASEAWMQKKYRYFFIR